MLTVSLLEFGRADFDPISRKGLYAVSDQVFGLIHWGSWTSVLRTGNNTVLCSLHPQVGSNLAGDPSQRKITGYLNLEQ